MRVLILRYGANRAGGVDAAAVAREFGVTPRTVRRWLHASHGRSVAHIPPARLEQLIAVLMPAQDTLDREDTVARNSVRDALATTRGRGRGIKPSWRSKGWDRPHVVAVLDHRALGVRQIAAVRAEPGLIAQLRKRGRIVDFVEVPTRFHANVVIHRVLTDLRPWRFEALPGQVRRGFTQSWLADAPATDLTVTWRGVEGDLIATRAASGRGRRGRAGPRDADSGT